jgi:hypothetical protein
MIFRAARVAVPTFAAVLVLCQPAAARISGAAGQASGQQQPPAQTQAQPPQAQAPAAQPAPPPSLAEIAAQEAERRKHLKPTKVYTDKDAKPYKGPEPSAAGAAKPEEGAAAEGAGKDAGKAKEGDEAAPKGEEYWRGRMTDAQETLRKDEMFKDALQSRINALTADYTNRDDPAQRALIGEERQKALAELARLTDTIEKDKKRIADIEEEARRAGVPPGWIR